MAQPAAPARGVLVTKGQRLRLQPDAYYNPAPLLRGYVRSIRIAGSGKMPPELRRSITFHGKTNIETIDIHIALVQRHFGVGKAEACRLALRLLAQTIQAGKMEIRK